MKKLLLFFTVILSLIGVSQSAFADDYEHTVYVDISNTSWNQVYFQIGWKGGDNTPQWNMNGQATVVPNTDGKVYKCVFTYGNDYSIRFSKAQTDDYKGYLKTDAAYNGTDRNGAYCTWNSGDFSVADNCKITLSSSNGRTAYQANYTPPSSGGGDDTDGVTVELVSWTGTNYGTASYKDGVWMVTASNIPAAKDNDSNAKLEFKVTYADKSVKYVAPDNNNHWLTSTNSFTATNIVAVTSAQSKAFLVQNADASKGYDFLLTMSADGTNPTKILVREHESTLSFEDWPTKKWNLETAFRSVYDTPQVGDKLYFYLSTTQNDNRVGPEWMLLPKDSKNPRAGEFVLEDFMVIPNGNFRIREFTYNGPNSHSYTDLMNSAGAVELGKSSFGISQGTPLSSDAQPKVELTLTDGGGLSKWQIGYTRMTVTVKQTTTPASQVDAFSRTDNVIVYTGSTYNKVYAWTGGSNNGTWPGQDLEELTYNGTTYRYAKLKQAYQNFIFVEWNINENKEISRKEINSVSLTGNIQFNGSSISQYTGTIPKIGEPEKTEVKMTAALLLDKPSTLSEAPVQGMPYLTLYGSKLKPRLGSSQKLDYILDLDNNADTEAYTNAYLQYDEEGNLYVYGDNITSAYYVQNDTEGTPATGKVMNSTIQPPRNLMYFRLTDDIHDTYYDLTSRATQFQYEGTYSDEATANASNGAIKFGRRLQPTYEGKTAATGTRYARYYLENFNMLGHYKIMSGYGSHKYATVVNGLSLYTNWGTGTGGTYEALNVASGTVSPLSGAGPIFTQNETTSSEDNLAGMYVGFPSRSYVSRANFYYAIDHDQIYETGSIHYHNHGDVNVVGNNGRNSSWIMFVYNNSAAQIDLKKFDADKARMTWQINDKDKLPEDDEGRDFITHYKVELFKANKEGRPDGNPVYTYTSENFSPSVNYVEPTTQEAVDADDDLMALDGGSYVAKLTYYGKLIIDELQEEGATREVLSPVIKVIKVDSDPYVEANQVTYPYTFNNEEGTEYTFDGLIESNLRAYVNELLTQGSIDEVAGNDFTAKLTIPLASWQILEVENEAGEMKAPQTSDISTDAAKGTTTINLGTYFLNAGENYRLPKVRVSDYVPGKVYDVTLDVTAKVNDADNPVVKATAKTELFIKAPAGKFAGNMQTGTTVVFDASTGKRTENYTFDSFEGLRIPGKEDYNFVSVPDGYISIEGSEILNATTAQKWKAVYTLALGSGDDETISLFDTPQEVNGHGSSTIKKLLNAPVSNIGYVPEMDGETVVNTPASDYSFTVVTNYTLTNPPAEAKATDYTSVITDNPRTTVLTYQPESLKAPRTGLADLNATGSNDPKAKDWVRVKYDWFEQYSGAFRVVEDAYVAAEVGEPSELAFKFDVYSQYIRHNSKSVFNKNKHLSTTDGSYPHKDAPGLRLPQVPDPWNNQVTTMPDTEGNVWWFNTGRKDAPAGFEERVWRLAGDLCNEGDTELPQADVKKMVEGEVAALSNDKKIAHEPGAFWAGCPESIWDSGGPMEGGVFRETYYVSDKTWDGQPIWSAIDRLNPYLGLYGNRNHQTRRAWDGGEVFENKWLSLCVTKRAVQADYDDNGVWQEGYIDELLPTKEVDGIIIPNPFESPEDANSYYKANQDIVHPGVDYAWGMQDSGNNPIGGIDAGLNLEEQDVLGRTLFLGGKFAAPQSDYKPMAEVNGGKGMMRVMLRVPHVNHESWWEPRAGYTEGLQRWKKDYANEQITNLAGDKKTVGVDASFEDMLEGLIMVPTKYYAPMEYSFVYEYPFLNTNKFAKATPSVPQEANSVNMTRFTATGDEEEDNAQSIRNHTYIPAVSTGEIPFDYATTGSGKGTATAVESVGADNGDGADRFSVRYDRSIDAVVVSSSAPLGDIRVVSTTGALLRHVAAPQQSLVTIPVDALSSGAYIVSVEGRKGVTFLK